MGIESISTGASNIQEKYTNFPVIPKTRDGVGYILETARIGDDLIFLLDGEKIGIIEYNIDIPMKQCYIAFFGTQNGLAAAKEYKKLLLLDSYSPNQDLQGISYAMMQRFIETICYPNHLERIYLDSDTQGKKFFWKDKIGKYFKDMGVFTSNGVRSSGTEVCFTLSSKN